MTARRRRGNEVMHRAEDWRARDEDHEQRVRALEFLPEPRFIMPWVRRRYTAASHPGGPILCPDANDVAVTWNDAGDPASAFVQGSDDWESYFTIDSALNGEIAVAGQIIISGKIRWTDDTGMETMVIMHDGGGFSEILSHVDLRNLGGVGGENIGFTFKHNYPAGRDIQLNVAQNTSGSGTKELFSAWMMFTYLSAYTGPNLNSPDDPDLVE